MFAHFDIHPCVHRIAAQGFIIEVHVVQAGVVELVHTQACQIELFVGFVFVHWLRSVDDLR